MIMSDLLSIALGENEKRFSYRTPALNPNKNTYIATSLLSSDSKNSLSFLVPWLSDRHPPLEEKETLTAYAEVADSEEYRFIYKSFSVPFSGVAQILLRTSNVSNTNIDTVMGNIQLILGELLIKGESDPSIKFEVHKVLVSEPLFQRLLIDQVKHDAIQALLIGLLNKQLFNEPFAKESAYCSGLNEAMAVSSLMHTQLATVALRCHELDTVKGAFAVAADLLKNNFKVAGAKGVIELVFCKEENLRLLLKKILADPLPDSTGQIRTSEHFEFVREYLSHLTLLVNYALKDFDGSRDSLNNPGVLSDDEDEMESDPSDAKKQEGNGSFEDIDFVCSVKQIPEERLLLYSVIMNNLAGLVHLLSVKHEVTCESSRVVS